MPYSQKNIKQIIRITNECIIHMTNKFKKTNHIRENVREFSKRRLTK